MNKTALAIGLAASVLGWIAPAAAQQTESRLYEVTKNRTLRVCIYPGYFAIAYRDPATSKLTGIDIDLSQELGKELGAEVIFDSASNTEQTVGQKFDRAVDDDKREDRVRQVCKRFNHCQISHAF